MAEEIGWLWKWYSFEHIWLKKCELVSALQKTACLDLWSKCFCISPTKKLFLNGWKSANVVQWILKHQSISFLKTNWALWFNDAQGSFRNWNERLNPSTLGDILCWPSQYGNLYYYCWINIIYFKDGSFRL